MTGYDVGGLRAREFAWADTGETVYLNHASTGTLPRRTVEALHSAIALRTVPSRFSDELLWSTLAQGRALAARLVGALPAEIALATNTSFGLNLAAFGLPLGPGDVVVGPDREFPANVYPWMAAARRRGVEYRRVPEAPDGGMDEERLLRELEDPRVRALTVSWVGFVDGYRCDLARLGRACRERDVLFVVDAIQGLGAATLDVRACEVDVLACGAQKWLLSPWGTGFVYVRESLVRRLEPHVVGWTGVQGSDDFSRLLDYDPTWRDDARRFEALTLPAHDFMGMNASLELLLELGPAAVERHVASLVDMVLDWASGRPDVVALTPADPARRAGIVSLRFADPAAASARLHAAGVAHSLREGAVRFSPHCYTTRDDIAHALAALERVGVEPSHR